MRAELRPGEFPDRIAPPSGAFLALAWLAELKRRVDEPARVPRAALRLLRSARPGVTIGSVDPQWARAQADAGVGLRAQADGTWAIDGSGPGGVDAALADLAGALRDRGALPTWRGECLAVTDESGQRVGAIERAAVRPLGIATQAVHLVALDTRGHVWVQLRARDKANDPGRWDTTVGGLVSDGETPSGSLAREMWEEAGLREVDLRALTPVGALTVRRPMPEGYMVEHIDVFEAALSPGCEPANQDGEVERFECWDAALLAARLQQEAFTLEASLILAQWLGPHLPAPH